MTLGAAVADITLSPLNTVICGLKSSCKDRAPTLDPAATPAPPATSAPGQEGVYQAYCRYRTNHLSSDKLRFKIPVLDQIYFLVSCLLLLLSDL